MSLLEYILLFSSVILGGGLAFYFKRNNPSILQMVLSFSGAYLLGITVLHLMPEVYTTPQSCMGYWVLVGFFIQLLLEQLSGGVEHGHIHPTHKATGKFALSVMIGLCVHAFLEGIPLSHFTEFSTNHHHHNHLLYGIILHKAPAAFALTLLLLISNYSQKLVGFCLLIFAMMSPLGAGLAEWITMDSHLHSVIIAIVLGSFLHISTTILFELDTTSHHRISWKKMIVVVGGLGLAMLSELF